MSSHKHFFKPRRRRAVPHMHRLARLTVAMDEVQFAAEVRRTQPLALRLQRLGGIDLLPGLGRARSPAAADTQ